MIRQSIGQLKTCPARNDLPIAILMIDGDSTNDSESRGLLNNGEMLLKIRRCVRSTHSLIHQSFINGVSDAGTKSILDIDVSFNDEEVQTQPSLSTIFDILISLLRARIPQLRVSNTDQHKPQVAARLASMSYRSSTLSSRVCGTPLGWVRTSLLVGLVTTSVWGKESLSLRFMSLRQNSVSLYQAHTEQPLRLTSEDYQKRFKFPSRRLPKEDTAGRHRNSSFQYTLRQMYADKKFHSQCRSRLNFCRMLKVIPVAEPLRIAID
ncbi:hypothetical protein WN51_03861 [Melipona quadrifasciata]|uniref:Uncharacterized protein n=1 Tax=Melipona quadrifasciata TaxID=166423 RepID=A0A0M9ADA5_9HYME|nr:hypothetical protein WN51_03861 [Melipona quadrifasciata]